MSTLKVTGIQHPSALAANIVLNSDETIETSGLITETIQHPSAVLPNLVLNADGTVDGPGVSKIVAVNFGITSTVSATSTAAGAVTGGVSLSHTATDANNIIYLIGMLSGNQEANASISGLFRADSVAISTLIGTAAGSRSLATLGNSGVNAGDKIVFLTGVGKTIAGSTSAVTYSLDFLNADTVTRVIYLNRTLDDNNSAPRIRTVSTLLLFEVRP
jgi:hypothetical protein